MLLWRTEQIVTKKGAYVNIQTNTDSIANPDTMFEKMINNQNKSLEISLEDPSSPVKRQNTHYTEMSLFNTFYEDYIDLKITSGIYFRCKIHKCTCRK